MKTVKMVRPRQKYSTEKVLYMRIPSSMVTPCRELVKAMCEADIPDNEVQDVMKTIKALIQKHSIESEPAD